MKCTCANLDYSFCPVHKKFAFPLDISKAYEEKGDWIVEGWASITDIVDLQDQVVTPEAIKLSEGDLEQYSTLLFNHDPNRPIGRILKTEAEEKGLWVKARISKANPDIWQMVKDGTLSKFSIKGKATEIARRFDKVKNKAIEYIKRMFLTDASLVTVPAQGKAEAVAWYVAKALETLKGGIIMDDKDKEIQFEELSADELALLDKAEKGELTAEETEKMEKQRQARVRRQVPGYYPYAGYPYPCGYPYYPYPKKGAKEGEKDEASKLLKELSGKLDALLEKIGKPVEKLEPKPDDKPKEEPKPGDKSVEKLAKRKPKEEPPKEEPPKEEPPKEEPAKEVTPKEEPAKEEPPKEEPNKEGEEIKKTLEALNQKIEEIQKNSSPEKVQEAVKEFVKSLPDSGALKKSLIESQKKETPKDDSLESILSEIVGA